MKDFTTPSPLPPGSTLVIGFLGGIEKWNGEVHRVRRLALDLREKNLSGVYVETVENHHRQRAIALIQRQRARAERDFTEADRLRDEIAAAGWEVRDVSEGFQLVPK